MIKIGIFGGTFDPIHVEHVSMVKSAIKELNLDKLIVLPTYVSPHKQNNVVTDGAHRYNMLKLAFDGVDKVEVSPYELDKGGVSYTYQTILHYKQAYANGNLYFLMGSDMLENFPYWKNPQIIADNANLVLTVRKGSGFNDNELINTVRNLYNANVIKLEYVGENVSSTMARTYLKLGLSTSEILPIKVSEYIALNGLYTPNNLYSFVKSKLTEKRLYHTANVILTALKLCKSANVSKEEAEVASLLHDVAKYENPANYNFAETDAPAPVIHQFVGAHIVKNLLNVDNENVINAVKYHTTGRPNMTNLEKLVFIADLIEPTRNFEGVDILRQAVFNNFDSGFKLCVSELYKFLLKKGEPVYYLTKDCAEYYKKEN